MVVPTGLTEFRQRGRRVRRQTSRLGRRAGVRIEVGVPNGPGVSGRAGRRVDHVHELRVGAVQAVRPQRHVLETGTGRVQTCGTVVRQRSVVGTRAVRGDGTHLRSGRSSGPPGRTRRRTPRKRERPGCGRSRVCRTGRPPRGWPGSPTASRSRSPPRWSGRPASGTWCYSPRGSSPRWSRWNLRPRRTLDRVPRTKERSSRRKWTFPGLEAIVERRVSTSETTDWTSRASTDKQKLHSDQPNGRD